MGARWYDGEDAAFASRDSVRGNLNSPISLNRYTYAFGDPLSYFDPDGHWPKLLDKAVNVVGNKAKEALKVAARVVAAPVRFQVAMLTTTASKAASAVVRHVETGRKFVAGIKVGGVRLGEYGAALAVSTRGATRGVANLAKGVTRPVVDPLGTARDTLKTYRESGGGLSGALHALNETFNPAVSLLHSGDAYLSAWKAGDYEAMAEAGIGLTASAAATVAAAVGAGRLAAFKSAARPKPRPCNSFVAGTAVLMANGSRKAIEDVDLGDMVAAVDPESGQEGSRMVTALITGHGEKRLVDITVDGQTIVATDGHPFWVENRRRWVRAADLVVGDDVLLDATGRTRNVQQIKIRNLANQTVHNLTVDGLHTYFVLAGKTPLLTHNSSSCNIGGADGPRNAPQTVLRNARPAGSGSRLPMTNDCVCDVAGKYGIDISDLNIKIDKSLDGVYGITGPDQTIRLSRAAFRNEEQLARTMAHERYHVVEQLRQGMPYPRTRSAAEPYEDAARNFENNWWSSHPLNNP